MVGVAIMIAAIVAMFIGIAGVVDSSIDAVDSPRIDVPGERVVPLEAGSYALYAPRQEPGAGSIADVRVGDVEVTGPAGAPVPFGAIDTRLVVNDGVTQWAAVGQFAVDEPGDHRIAIGPPADTTVMVAPTIAEVGERSVLWVVLAGTGFVSFVIGVVVMFTGVARRSGDTGPGADGPFGRKATSPDRSNN